MKKKMISILLTAVLTAVLLAGCTGESGGSGSREGESKTGGSTTESGRGKETELLLWMPPFGTGDSLDKEFWTKTLEPWADENNVKLSIEITHGVITRKNI